MIRVRDFKCINCGCKSPDKSRFESHGEVSCIECGAIPPDIVIDSSPAPVKEGDDTRPGGTIRRFSPGVLLDPTPREGDILRNLPRGKRRAICDEENGGCGKTQLIRDLTEKCNNKKCGSSNWRYKQSKHSLPVGKDVDWIAKRQAKQFLQLGKHDDETNLSDDIKNLDLSQGWIDLVKDAISNAGLPERTPDGEEGSGFSTPMRERIGIEVYLSLTHQQHCFWFFDDYLQRLRLSPQNIERILQMSLPISKQFQQQLPQISDRNFGLNPSRVGFISRCSSIFEFSVPLPQTLPSWFTNPPEVLWEKLALGIRKSESSFLLRYWVPVPEWDRSYNDSKKVQGLVREYPRPLILRHIPAAYFIAQEILSRGDNNARRECTRILEMIEKDLRWCAATVEEMDNWWNELWSENSDGTPSVTSLRVTRAN